MDSKVVTDEPGVLQTVSSALEEPLSNDAESSVKYCIDPTLRQIWLTKEIDSDIAREVCESILFCNYEDTVLKVPQEERVPIILYISCPGGNVADSISIINVIEESITPVYTVNLGYAYSAAFLINLAGHKRYSLEMSTYLMHDGAIELECGYSKAHDYMDFKKKMDVKMKDFVLKHSVITSEEYTSKFRTEWYMFADEAKEYGFVDCILKDDCDITSILPLGNPRSS